MPHYFDYEQLHMYKLAVQVARWMRSTPWPSGNGKLRDQAVRAADSVVLNIAEGRMRGGVRAGRNHYRIALGSAGEAAAVLDLIDLPAGAEHQQLLRRIGAMLCKAAR